MASELTVTILRYAFLALDLVLCFPGGFGGSP